MNEKTTRDDRDSRGYQGRGESRGEGRGEGGGGGGYRGRRDDDYDDGGDDDRRSFGGGFGRRKVCRFCTEPEIKLDYKDTRLMQLFMSDQGRLVPRRVSGNCARHQRRVTSHLKRARQLALVGYVSLGGGHF